jgi:hypothetical protein
MAASTSSQVQFGELEQLVDRLKSTVQKTLEDGNPPHEPREADEEF